jgi:NAD(P) transhydrogenase subunit alpha
MTASKWTAIFVIGAMLMAVSSVTAAADPPPSAAGPAAQSTENDDSTSAKSDTADTSSAAQLGKLITYLTVFVLAIFVGFEVITKVPPTLHTPLMSGSNAISGITVIGAVLLAGALQGGEPGSVPSQLGKVLAFIAVIFATVNVVGGYLVTDRMLRMFKRR